MNHEKDIPRIIALTKTTQDLVNAGGSTSSISRQTQQKQLHRLRHGVYMDAATWKTLNPTQKYVASTVAVLKTSTAPVLSHQTAALWYGAPLLSPPTSIHLAVAQNRIGKRRGVTAHCNKAEVIEDSCLLHGFAVSSALHTVVDCAGVLPLNSALCIADYFAHHGLVSIPELQEALKQKTGRGAAVSRTVAARVSPCSESPAESIARNLMHQWKIPLPEEQSVIYTRSGGVYRPDFLWREHGVILEVDGEVKYSGIYGDAEVVIRREHRRQRELEAEGWKIIRARWNELLNHPHTLRRRLAAAGIR
ncbi:type IV toxin-antitoxin system AbiEi family antitoxin domain-containing protein [Rothia terrae]|uniref:Type IV toxin-antitoxin system AbiEi family antitoxin domain-containing protein n=1 Tax=Rothia terrae TaxID=396015 RepID=A0A7H2BFG1_9MICC|nr:type IV toxin-antitoxin system AbiEi family antitoxin domain-containing protein [Rothia terrae]QNV38407.1 hypothetical protein IDM49_03815 [Rothia terrae]